jgi:integrase
LSDHIERRRNLWYATLTVPADIRGKLGKHKFIQSLGTPDKRKALALAAPLIATWRAIIRRERGEVDAVTAEALRWRLAITEEAAAFVPQKGLEEFDEPAIDHLVPERAEEIEAKFGPTAARKFAQIALGITLPSSLHFEPWLAQQSNLAQKTQDQMRKDVALLVARYPTLREITHQSIKRWMDELTLKQVSPSSQTRITSFCRSYWRYLQSVDVVPSDVHPFSNLSGILKEKRKATPRGSWEPFTPADVVKLYKAALAQDEPTLADLIQLGAYTGARIEELCALKVANVADESFKIVDAKTDAGIREVPLHSAIRPLVQRLKKASEDGYLLSGLTFNKYGDRSNNLGKRFGKLKTAQGFESRHVFHSIRKTTVTLLEDAGVSENLAADIVGHVKPRITYGLYSGGSSLATKADAVEKIRYPAWSKRAA